MRMACAVLFVLFTFCYLFFYQADILTVGQHILSGGMTHYNKWVGAVLITLVLMLLQVGMYGLTKLQNRFHAVTYLPSFVVLTFITSVSRHLDDGFTLGPWLWGLPLLVVVIAALIYIGRQYQEIERDVPSVHPFTSIFWINLSTLFVGMILTLSCSQGDETFHQRMRMEQLIIARDYEGALRVGSYGKLKDDSCMTMLRIYALAREHALGDRLFSYPLEGGADAMLPNGSNVRAMILPDSIIVNTTKYSKDYRLCRYLFKRDLVHFAHHLAQVSDLSKPLPRHYAEALFLYNTIFQGQPIKSKYAYLDGAFRKYAAHPSSMPHSYWYYYYGGKVPKPMPYHPKKRNYTLKKKV